MLRNIVSIASLGSITSWWPSSPAPPTTMSKNGSDGASNQVGFNARKGRREMSGDDTSGGKDTTLDSQGLLQSGNHGEEYKLDKTAPSMGITKPESSHPRGRHACDSSTAKDPELVPSAQRGAGHLRKHPKAVKGLTQKDLEYTKNEQDEVQNTKNTGLSAAQAEADDLREEPEESERYGIWLSKGLDDERRKKKDSKNIKVSELGLAQKEIDTLRQKLDQTEKECRWRSKALDIAMKETETLKNEIGKARRHIEDLRNEVETTHGQINKYVVHCERQNQELQATREQLQRAEVVHQQTREQLAERTAELKSAQLFIDVADSVSGADIISMTASLNAEILQSAALMADSLDHTKRRGKPPNEVLLKVQENIGEVLTRALIDQRSIDGEDVDPTPVQLALQVCLVHCSKVIITSWSLGGNDDRLSGVYSRIWNKEQQPVAGRWRSMTQMYAIATDGSNLALQMIIRAVKRVLIATRTNYHPFTNQFQESLSAINTLSLRLRSSIGQYITSMEIRPFTIEPGMPFDPNQMEDTYAEERKANSMVGVVGGHVAGSTELGLISQVKDISGKVETKVMLKPKVVLCSALTEDG